MSLSTELGVVGWGKGVVYLTLPGYPTEFGLQLGKACYPCSRVGMGRGRWVGESGGRMFLFFLFLHFHSFSSFFPVPLISSTILSPFSLSLGDDTKWPTRVDVSLNPT